MEDGDQQTHQLPLRGGGTNVTSELCKVAAWERRGVCVCVRGRLCGRQEEATCKVTCSSRATRGSVQRFTEFSTQHLQSCGPGL